jgi:hypothetical protein
MADEHGSVEGRLHLATHSPADHSLFAQFEPQIDQKLPVLSSYLPVLDDAQHGDGLFVGGNIESVLFAARQAFGVAHFQDVLFAGDKPQELDAPPAEEFHAGNVLEVPEDVLGNLDAGELRGNGEGLHCPAFLPDALAPLPLQDVVLGNQRQDVLFEVGESQALYAIVLLQGEFGTVVELSVDALPPS